MNRKHYLINKSINNLGYLLKSIPSEYIQYYEDESSLKSILDIYKANGIDSKSIVIYGDFQGRIIQKCPASPGMICCNYYVINSAFGCFFNCAYCFLHSYLNLPGIKFIFNEERMKNEINLFLSENENKLIRIGNGQFSDSLMSNESVHINKFLIKQFSDKQNIYFEMKSKATNIEELLSTENKGNAVISWSITTPRNQKLHELGTSNVYERIEAAAAASKHGYSVGFHFDPVIRYKNWEKEYTLLIEELSRKIKNQHVIWISIGGLRFQSDFKWETRTSNQLLTIDENILCPDNKYRYSYPIRKSIYLFFVTILKKYFPDTFIYLCMESSNMWYSIFNRNYSTPEDLEADFIDYLNTRKRK